MIATRIVSHQERQPRLRPPKAFAVAALLCAAVWLEGCTYLNMKKELERGIANKRTVLAVRYGENKRLEIEKEQLRAALAGLEEAIQEKQVQIDVIGEDIQRERQRREDSRNRESSARIEQLKREKARLQDKRDEKLRRHAEILKILNERVD